VDDIVEVGMVDQFVAALSLKGVPAKKLTGLLQPTSGMMSQRSSTASTQPQAQTSGMLTPVVATPRTSGVEQQQQLVARLTDVTDEPLVNLGPIVGIEKCVRLPLMEVRPPDTPPMFSAPQPAQPNDHVCPQAALATLVDDMDAYGYSAAERGAELAHTDPHGLDADECAALTLYTMECELCAPPQPASLPPPLISSDARSYSRSTARYS
jgi:hypothetical protein